MLVPMPSARERILDTAYDLFSRHGIRAVGVDRIIATSGVAKMSLYRHFHSKEALVLAFLQEREKRWTMEWLHAEASKRADDGAGRMLAIFDVFDEWFRKPDFEGCSFINVLLEFSDVDHPIWNATTGHLATIRGLVREFAEDAGVADPEAVACQWHILMKGSIVAAGWGDRDAARRAQALGELLLEREGVLTAG
jgi:AcrR family transcriptional regulator